MSMKTLTLKALYTADESLWIFENVKLIRAGKISQVDWENIVEELEDMGKSQYREVFSRMIELFLHLLKWMLQKEYTGSNWAVSIQKQQDELNEIFTDSQNLKNYAQENAERAYAKAKKRAGIETNLPDESFPQLLPFTLDEALDENYKPE